MTDQRRNSDRVFGHVESTRVGLTASFGMGRVSAREIRIGEKRDVETMKECWTCGSPSPTHKWLTFAFCSKHSENAKRLARAFPTAASLDAVGLFKKAK